MLLLCYDYVLYNYYTITMILLPPLILCSLLLPSTSANRELCALGVSNIIGSFFQAFPSFASVERTQICYVAGGQVAAHYHTFL